MPSATHLCLGGITGPLLVFGGPYSNLQALEALQQAAKHLQIPPERCFCTGDMVAYCGQPKETVQAIRQWGIHCLMGNCEASFANNDDNCGCGFNEGSQCDLLSAQWFHFANNQLGHTERQWFRHLPHTITFSINNIDIQLVHGSVSSINQFIFASTPKPVIEQELDKTQADVVVGGHCGIPFSQTLHGRLWHNTGAIGMPANDATPRGWFSIISAHPQGILIDTQSFEYDYHTAQTMMIDAGLNNGYAQALKSGLWPSIEVLPEIERQQQGQALQPQRIIYRSL